jgi:hypothetical protein
MSSVEKNVFDFLASADLAKHAPTFVEEGVVCVNDISAMPPSELAVLGLTN